MKQFNLVLLYIIALLLLSPQLRAQEFAIVFDSMKADGSVHIDYGTITRTEANNITLHIRFQNTTRHTFRYMNMATAWNDATDLVHYASKLSMLKPCADGTFQFELKLYNRRFLNHYGTLVFTDEKGQEERHEIKVFARIADSLLPIFTDPIVSLPYPQKDSVYQVNQGKQSGTSRKPPELAIRIKNISAYTIALDTIAELWGKGASARFSLNRGFSRWRTNLAPQQEAIIHVDMKNVNMKGDYWRHIDLLSENKLRIEVRTERGILHYKEIPIRLIADLDIKDYFDNKLSVKEYSAKYEPTTDSIGGYRMIALYVDTPHAAHFSLQLEDKRDGAKFYPFIYTERYGISRAPENPKEYITHYYPIYKHAGMQADRSTTLFIGVYCPDKLDLEQFNWDMLVLKMGEQQLDLNFLLKNYPYE